MAAYRDNRRLLVAIDDHRLMILDFLEVITEKVAIVNFENIEIVMEKWRLRKMI